MGKRGQQGMGRGASQPPEPTPDARLPQIRRPVIASLPPNAREEGSQFPKCPHCRERAQVREKPPGATAQGRLLQGRRVLAGR